MGNLLSLLQQSATSLGAQTAFMQTSSNNVENANTPGYSRQTANLQDVLPAEYVGGAYVGQGAILGSVTQTRDKFVESQLPTAFGNSSASSAESSALASVTVLDPTGALPTALSSFYSGLQGLSQDPGDPSLRAAAVSDAQQLTLAFNQTSSALTDARSGIDTELTAQVSTVNSLTAQVASYNKQIKVASAGGASPNDLLDARQEALDQLSQLTGASQVPTSDGSISVVLQGGTALVSGDKAATLSTTPDPANGGHVMLQVARLDGSGTTAVTGSLTGTMGGEMAARDGGMKTAQDSVDQLAYDVGNAINTVHAAGYALDGSTGRNLFNVSATASGAAASISVNSDIVSNNNLLATASTSPVASGDATNVQAMLNTQNTVLSSGLNPSDTVSATISQFGASASLASATSTQDSAIQDQLTQLRDSASGVSIDDEMVNMMQAQRSYEAIAKVITTSDAMLQALMNLT